jgi:ribose transport system permease protein
VSRLRPQFFTQPWEQEDRLPPVSFLPCFWRHAPFVPWAFFLSDETDQNHETPPPGRSVPRSHDRDRVVLDPAETREFFLTYHNFKTIFTQTVIVAIGALGMTMIIVSGGIDLSVGSSIAFTSVVGALLIQQGWGPLPALLAMIASGGLIGLLNGAAIAALRLVPFIITLGTLGVMRGSAKWLGDNQTVNYDASPINTWMTTADPFSYVLPAGVWVTLGLAILTSILLRYTVFGRHLFALGSNEATARLCGIPTTRLKIAIYALAGCFFGLAGVFQLSRLRQGDPTVAVGLELDIIAAVIIGGASLKWRRRHDPRLDDRRSHHGGPPQRFAA